MLQYLIILLDDTSVSFCYHNNSKNNRSLIPLDVLYDGIKFGMKENLYIQFVLPDYKLPKEYWQAMMTIDHSIIAPGHVDYNNLVPVNEFYQLPNVVVFESVDAYLENSFKSNQSYVLKIDMDTLFQNMHKISNSINKVSRLNVVIDDIETFTDADFDKYKECLACFSDSIITAYRSGRTPQVNLITDRMMLNEMNNCNAGVSNITLAPDGMFYICPAFYQSGSVASIGMSNAIGSVKTGLDIKNYKLYRIDHAPLCRNCDAFHCKRCVWLNNKTTFEVNTPSHQQCVISHLERNASRKLLCDLRMDYPQFLDGISIGEINYLDPFDVKQEL